jgi:hypothetical protein
VTRFLARLVFVVALLGLVFAPGVAGAKNKKNGKAAAAKKVGKGKKGKKGKKARGKGKSDKPGKKAKGKKRVKVFDFTGLDLAGRLRTPQLIYFLDRAAQELELASLERRSFIPDMVKSVDEESF